MNNKLRFFVPGRIGTILISTTVIISSACSTVSPLSGHKLNPKDKIECVNACKDLDMNLGAFVIVSGRSGCVCEPKSKNSSSNSSASAVGGAVAIAIEEEEQANQGTAAKKR